MSVNSSFSPAAASVATAPAWYAVGNPTLPEDHPSGGLYAASRGELGLTLKGRTPPVPVPPWPPVPESSYAGYSSAPVAFTKAPLLAREHHLQQHHSAASSPFGSNTIGLHPAPGGSSASAPGYFTFGNNNGLQPAPGVSSGSAGGQVLQGGPLAKIAGVGGPLSRRGMHCGEISEDPSESSANLNDTEGSTGGEKNLTFVGTDTGTLYWQEPTAAPVQQLRWHPNRNVIAYTLNASQLPEEPRDNRDRGRNVDRGENAVLRTLKVPEAP